MSELKKGDPVMTDRGIAINHGYGESAFCPHGGYLAVLIGSGFHLWGATPYDTPLSSEHREQIEAYLKEKGWEESKTSQYQLYFKGNFQILLQFKKIGWELHTPVLRGEDFDTAPAQLQEAMTMAKLLNATKP